MNIFRRTVVASIISAVGLTANLSIAHADTYSYSTPFFDVYYDSTQLPSSFWSISSSSSTALNNGSGYFDLIITNIGDEPQYNVNNAATFGTPGQSGQGLLSLNFNYKGAVTSTSDSNQVATETIEFAKTQFTSTTTFQNPVGAQLATSLGKDSLFIEANSAILRAQNNAITSSQTNVNQVSMPSNLNLSSPIYSVFIKQDLIGPNLLVASSDPNCASILCMPSQRASAKLETFDIRFTVNTVLAPVPEPETYAMLLAGLGLIGLTARRRNKQ